MRRALPPGSVTALVLPVILVLAGYTFWPAVTGPFLFDDFHNLGNLSKLQGVVDWQHLRDYLASFPGLLGRPISTLSFLLNDASWPTDPRPFKVTNLLIHLLNGVLVFGLARALGGTRPELAARAEWIALLTALVWLVHPIQISASMLTVQRMTLLAAGFGIAGLWSYVALAMRARTWRGALAAIAALGTGTLLACLCKENGALFPLLAWVVNATMLRDRLADTEPAARRVLALGVIVPSLAVVLTFAWIVLPGPSLSRRDFDTTERLLTQARVVCDYLLHIVLPRLSGSGIYFDDFSVSRSLFDPPTTIFAVIAIGAILGAAFGLRGRSPVIAFGLLWYFCAHLLESTALPLELYFEHRNYVPLLGPAFALAALVSQLGARLRRPVMGGLLLWTGLLVLISHSQARVWGDERAMALIWGQEHPLSERAALHRTEFLARKGEIAKASAFLQEASRLQPRSTAIGMGLVVIDCQTRRKTTAAALRNHIELLSTGAFSNAAMPALRSVRTLIGRGLCPGIEIADWLDMSAAALGNPHFVPVDAQAFLRVERAYAYAELHDLPHAKVELERAFAALPSAGLALNTAIVLYSAGDRVAASAWARRAAATRDRGLRGALSRDQARAKEYHEAIEQQLRKRPSGT